MAMRLLAGWREYRSIAHLAFFLPFAFAPILHCTCLWKMTMKSNEDFGHRNLDCAFSSFSLEGEK
jgi:hypothetical protein